MTQIEVKNFQSVGHAKITVEGFTALVGRSNIGKSAFVRAVRCALTNPVGTSFVRHGPSCARLTRKNAKNCKCFSSVHIKAEGFDLLWEKGDLVNRYVFNGSEYDKPERGTPDFLSDAGFGLVKAGEDSGCIQVADQFFPIFLLNQSGSAIAEAISDVSRLDRINAATRIAEKERREVLATRKVRESDIADLESSLGEYTSLEAHLGLVQQASDTLSRVESAQFRCTRLAGYLSRLEGLLAGITSLEKALAEPCPDVSGLPSVLGRVCEAKRLSTELTRRGTELKTLLDSSGSLGEVGEVEPLQGSLASATRLGGWVAKLQGAKKLFPDLELVSQVSLVDLSPLSAKLSRLAHIPTLLERLNGLESDLGRSVLPEDIVGLPVLPAALDKARKLSAFQLTLGRTSREVSELGDSMSGIESTLQAVQAELAQIDTCPTCQQPWDHHCA